MSEAHFLGNRPLFLAVTGYVGIVLFPHTRLPLAHCGVVICLLENDADVVVIRQACYIQCFAVTSVQSKIDARIALALFKIERT